jgi:hypothetical protein
MGYAEIKAYIPAIQKHGPAIMIMNKLRIAVALASTLALTQLTACGGGGGSTSSPQTQDGGGSNFEPQPAILASYNTNTAFASNIVACVTTTTCTLETLPLIGNADDTPTIDQIMDQLVVSDDWMAQRFRDMLEASPAQMLTLFRAVTAVVISSDIRPSHYKNSTGAIYIDPALLWQTNAEKGTIDQTPDFRSNFGKDLQFVRVWRFVIDNDYAWRSFSLTGTEERTFDDTFVLASWVFYHELAHANDCVTPQNMASFDQGQTFSANISAQMAAGTCVYQQLTSQNPLLSQTWLNLAQVFYQGAASTTEQRAMTSVAAGDAFALDHAIDAYSYSSVREDVAMAFEAVMMKIQFNADRDMAIIPQFTDFSCDNAQIKWGQRGRIALPEVKIRSEFVTDIILGDAALDDFYQNLPQEINISVDHNWCEPNLGKALGPLALDKAGFAKRAVEHLRYWVVIR